MSKDKKIIIATIILLVLAAGGYFFITKNYPNFLQKPTAANLEAIRAKAEKFINDNLVKPGTQAKIKDIAEESGVYKITVSVGSQDVVSYISKDGKEFFPQAIDMDTAGKTASSSSTPTPTANQSVSKNDKPSVELFVMSYCPYGLQMEKGILPVVELLGTKINFSLKFVDYSMHGDKEIQENMTQYCIGQQSFGKLDSYLNCFVKAGDSAACLSSAKIDTAKLNSCISAIDTQFKITQTAKDQSAWISGQYPPFNIYQTDNAKYNVSGSPTLVINGTTVSANRDPQSLFNLICSGFNNPPSECSQELTSDTRLSSDTPSPGFGEGTAAGSNSNAGCATN